ncbi:MAG: hypothetical protein H7123_00555 [Thermoleophilia bacterium]|nr:hypothetical protein [Thermoleophilia bacterium]
MSSRIDHMLLEQLVKSRSELGFVSVYASIDLAERNRWETELKQVLEATGGLPKRGASPTLVGRALLEAARGVTERLSGAAEVCRGVAGFIPVGSDNIHDQIWLELNEPIEAAAMVAERPFVLPLIGVLDVVQPAGVVVATHGTFALYEWQGDTLELLAEVDAEVDASDWRRHEGPRNDLNEFQSSFVDTDAYVKRIRAVQLNDLIERGRPVLGLHQQARSWDRLICFGPSEVTQRLVVSLRERVRVVEGGSDLLVGAPQRTIITRTRSAIESDLRERERELVERLTSSGFDFATRGLSQTRPMADMGRVALLLVNPHGHLDPEECTAIEQLIRSVYDQGGEVLAVREAAAESIADIDGVAATLRY